MTDNYLSNEDVMILTNRMLSQAAAWPRAMVMNELVKGKLEPSPIGRGPDSQSDITPVELKVITKTDQLSIPQFIRTNDYKLYPNHHMLISIIPKYNIRKESLIFWGKSKDMSDCSEDYQSIAHNGNPNERRLTMPTNLSTKVFKKFRITPPRGFWDWEAPLKPHHIKKMYDKLAEDEEYRKAPPFQRSLNRLWLYVMQSGLE